ncbi:hypothetical protein PLICBS_007565 [Purpureocillium lilacinum]|uniref:uncharacterized protein n=1 Tax=Purpureocillium lilacinum TaxID=33203 RepID=UPI002085B898|nr:hypothetical protein PLICBS_007565 [Purpureocillium lilacinum]
MIAAVWSLELLETHLALTNKFSILKKGSGDLIITGDQATLHPLHQYHQTRQYSWQRGANQVPTELIWPFRGTRSDRHCLDIITMYELFLTALVEDADFQAACAVLGGFCAMPPWETVNRVLYFQGPPRPAGISNQSSIDKPMRKDVAFLYKDLHQNLSRQSFVLQARYEILKDRDMGPSSAPQDLDAAAGILRWADFPDPPTARPVLTQRKVVELWEQKKLPSVMRDNNFQFKTETVEELYRFFRDDIEFCLSRQYFLKRINDYMPLGPTQHNTTEPLQTLPAWDALTPMDGQNRWVLQIKAHVLQDNKPDEIRKAQDQLMAIRGELDGVFDFKTIDRKVHDTRLAMQQQGIQALPQRVMLGKT